MPGRSRSKYALIDRGDAWLSWCPSYLGVADHSNTPCIRTDYDHPLWRQTAPRGRHAADDPLRAATVSGWGETTQTAADVQSATPNYRELRMYTPLECNDFFLRAGKTAWFTTSGLGASCAGTPPGEPYAGSCQGDSGGPLVGYRHVGGGAEPVAVVVGVVSFGDCGDDPDEFADGVHTSQHFMALPSTGTRVTASPGSRRTRMVQRRRRAAELLRARPGGGDRRARRGAVARTLRRRRLRVRVRARQRDGCQSRDAV